RLGRVYGAGRATRTTTDLARTFVLIGNVGGYARSTRGGGPAGRRRGADLPLSQTVFGFDFGLPLGLLFLLVAFFLCLAACLGSLALGLVDAFLAVAALGFFFRQPPLFDLASLGVSKCAGAGGAFILRQGREHHARIGAR